MAKLFEYEYMPTPVHALNSVTKLVLCVVIASLGTLYFDPRLQIPVFLLIIAIGLIARFPFRAYRMVILTPILLTLVAQSYRAIFMIDPSYFKVLPADWVSQVFLEVTNEGFPIIGRTAVTYGSIIWLVHFPLATAIVILTMSLFVYSTSLSELLQILYALKVPFPGIYITTVALRFTPEMIRKMETVQTAQMLRGWTNTTRNPLKKVKAYLPLMVPLVRFIIHSIDVMTLSTRNRAFGVGKATGLRDFTPSVKDIVVLSVSIVGFIIALYLLYFHNVGTI